jgi:hypothetical protein
MFKNKKNDNKKFTKTYTKTKAQKPRIWERKKECPEQSEGSGA